ncbi:MAG: hypothetical protein JNK05_05215 [Myxococcales bacterium]|nr:hypothetical protein [Myxococcales bacterium]
MAIDTLRSIRSPKITVTMEQVDRARRSISSLMELDGAVEAAVGDMSTGLALVMVGRSHPDEIDVAVAANSEVLRANIVAQKLRNAAGSIRDVLVTLDDRVHILRPLRALQHHFVYFAAERERCNLAFARMRVSSAAESIDL